MYTYILTIAVLLDKRSFILIEFLGEKLRIFVKQLEMECVYENI